MESVEHSPTTDHSGEPRLVTISQAAVATGLSRKAIARRIERGTLRAVHDNRGRRVVPLGELERAGMLRDDDGQGNPGGELVVWRDLYERERNERMAYHERAQQLERELVAIANAGPIRAMRLRRQVRAKLSSSS